MELLTNWQDYQILDAGDGEKLEKWRDIVLRRPDPTCLWPKSLPESAWNKADATYHRSNKGGGSWDFKRTLPSEWNINYRDLTFKVSPTNFKHTGLFPEQAINWDWMTNQITNNKRNDLKILNLFAYTGAATMACAKAGASEVVHVDAAKGMVTWAKENMLLNHLEDHKIRFLVDDVNKFVTREIRRNRKYDGILMDPPSYGRGPNGELWKLEDQLMNLINTSMELLSDEPLFFIINTYTTGYSTTALENLMTLTLKKKYPTSKIEVGPLGLPIKSNNLLLPCGITGRFYQ